LITAVTDQIILNIAEFTYGLNLTKASETYKSSNFLIPQVNFQTEYLLKEFSKVQVREVMETEFKVSNDYFSAQGIYRARDYETEFTYTVDGGIF
jgi:hypothetical protein